MPIEFTDNEGLLASIKSVAHELCDSLSRLLDDGVIVGPGEKIPENKRVGISVELLDAWDLPAPKNVPPAAKPTLAEAQVLSWLQVHAPDILSARDRRHDVPH
jgi:hypothetical protein